MWLFEIVNFNSYDKIVLITAVQFHNFFLVVLATMQYFIIFLSFILLKVCFLFNLIRLHFIQKFIQVCFKFVKLYNFLTFLCWKLYL